MAKAKILIVDDDRTTASVMKLYLKQFGYNVVGIATNGRESIEKANNLTPDLVLMDIKLGEGMDGIDAAEVISKHLNILIVFVTAHADDDILSRAKLSEPAGLINKPLREKDLKTTIELALTKVKKPKTGKVKKSNVSNEEILISIYSLTPAEARVAAKLVEYPELTIASNALNISVATAKTHLKRIFRKTNTNRQSVLIHKIINGPAGLIMKERNES